MILFTFGVSGAAKKKVQITAVFITIGPLEFFCLGTLFDPSGMRTGSPFCLYSCTAPVTYKQDYFVEGSYGHLK